MSGLRLMPFAFLAALCLTHSAAGAQQFSYDATPAEIAMLPEYCQARLGASAALSDKWRARIGPDKYIHLHHYCHGLKFLNRAPMARDQQTRRNQLQQATAEFDYVIARWPPDFPLAIDAKNKQAMAHSLLKMP